uniref:Uncharacterized protein n=1 Tax=Anguilla anguilla TaxID=7936 RepID=A0A0E9U514_ANGAN
MASRGSCCSGVGDAMWDFHCFASFLTKRFLTAAEV